MMFHTLGAVKNATGIGEDEPALRIRAEGRLPAIASGSSPPLTARKSRLIRNYHPTAENISVIPCGVNLDLFRPMDRHQARQQLGLGDEKIILFVGRIERLKGIDNLLKAIPLFRNGVRPRLVIVGGDGYRQGEVGRLKKLAADLQVRNAVTFSGLTDYERMPAWYNAADVCVFPSYYESFGLVPLESLACGTPVVAADVGDLRNIIRHGETGYVLTDNTPEHLAERLASVLSPSGGNLLDANSIRASVTRFGWQNIATRILREFESVVS